MPSDRICSTAFSSVHPLYVQKAERKQRSKEDVGQIIGWLTGNSQASLDEQSERQSDFATFFAEAPGLDPGTSRITGVVCGVRVEESEDPLMQKIRYLDKLVDELAKGTALEKILR